MNLNFPIRHRGNFGSSSRPPANPGDPSQYPTNVPRPQKQRFGRSFPRDSGASCEACYDMNPGFRPPPRHTKPDPSEIKVSLPEFLEASENNQCPFCTILLGIFLAYVGGAEEKVSRVKRNPRRSPFSLPSASVLIESGKPVEIHFREGIGAKEVSYTPLLLYGPVDEVVSNWPNLSALEDPAQELEDSFQFFKDQIDNCAENHPQCAQDDQRDLPKRLLDLDASDGYIAKLVNSNSLSGIDRRYAAVSHRWCGENVPKLETTKSSKKRHYSGIHKEGMPGVLLDAIRVTRALGLRYLWMDTLCMIQDDRHDKEEELPNMGAYYANAYFTISASSSADTRESFLKPRDEFYKPAEFPFGEDGNSIVHIRRWGAEGHLAERGWTWQESALSARVLNFAPSELIWECKSQVLSECGYELRNHPSLGLARRFHDVEQRPLELWQELVQSYSARELTRYTDVLPAISGLAQRVKDVTDSEYFAGIWGKETAIGLLWEAARDFAEPRPRVPVEYTAPSWSWASVQGKVRTSDTTMGNSSKHAGYRGPEGPIPVDRSFAALTPVIQIGKVDCTVPSKSQNPFGEVTGGSIELIGRLISVALSCTMKVTTGRTYMLKHPRKPDTQIRFSADTELWPFVMQLGQLKLFTALRSNNLSGACFTVPVECLLIAEGPGARAQDVTLDGIVLGRSPTNWNQRKRIGFFSFSDASWFAGAKDGRVTIV